jgi:hypothetical protein
MTTNKHSKHKNVQPDFDTKCTIIGKKSVTNTANLVGLSLTGKGLYSDYMKSWEPAS